MQQKKKKNKKTIIFLRLLKEGQLVKRVVAHAHACSHSEAHTFKQTASSDKKDGGQSTD